MDLKPINSTMISHAGFDPSAGVLAIRFHSGTEYHHTGVSAEKYAALLKAESAGKFYNDQVRGKHPFTKRERKH